ncbi:MAG: MBL fold metallo-hydrolase [Desulfobacterota bacterium]|nr:MBL fold metallo-hydrolase [Thermodesulfobacteriota bacterium]
MPKIAEGIYFIPGRDEMMPDSHTYLIGFPSSKDLSLIDPGLAGKGRYKLDSIRKFGIELEEVKRIIMTHTHFDHISALSEVQKEIPWAELWIHQAEADPLEEGDERTVYGMEMFQQVCQMQYGMRNGAFKTKVHRKLQGCETLKIGGMAWEVVHIPGHSLGSIGLYASSEKALIPGDVIYADHAIGRFDLFGADGSVLKESLRRLSELEVKILLPGHNRTVTNLPKGYIQETLTQWEPYLG